MSNSLLLRRRALTASMPTSNYIEARYSGPIKKLVAENAKQYVESVCINGLFYIITETLPEKEFNTVLIFLTDEFDLSGFFDGIDNIEYANFSNINKPSTNTLAGLFCNCKELKEVNFGNNLNDIIDMESCFAGCLLLSQISLPSNKIISLMDAFANCSKLKKVSGNLYAENINMINCFSNLLGTNFSESTLTIDLTFGENTKVDMCNMFYGSSRLENIIFKNFDTSKATNLDYIFKNCTELEYLDESKIIVSEGVSYKLMFYGCSKLSKLNLNHIIYGILDLSLMFYNCNNLKELLLNNLDTSNTENMMFMFAGCKSLESLYLPFNTSKVTRMDSMFKQCEKLKTLNISSFNTENVTNMHSMFRNCQSLTSLDIKHFNFNSLVYNGGLADAFDKYTYDYPNVDTFENINEHPSGVMFFLSGCFNLCEVKFGNVFSDEYVNGEFSLTFDSIKSFKKYRFYNFLDSEDGLINTKGCLYWPYLTEKIYDTNNIQITVPYGMKADGSINNDPLTYKNFNFCRIPKGICNTADDNITWNTNTGSINLGNNVKFDKNAEENYDTLPLNWNIVIEGAPTQNVIIGYYDIQGANKTIDLCNSNFILKLDRIAIYKGMSNYKLGEGTAYITKNNLFQNSEAGLYIVLFHLKDQSDLDLTNAFSYTTSYEDCLIGLDFSKLVNKIVNLKRAFKNRSRLQYLGDVNSFSTNNLSIFSSYQKFNTIKEVSTNSFEETFLGTNIKKLNITNIALTGENVLFKNAFKNSDLNIILLNGYDKISSWESAFEECSLLELVIFTENYLENCSNYKRMFYNCQKLHTILRFEGTEYTDIDTSEMFVNCKEITKLPPKFGSDKMNNWNATHMCNGCVKLTSIHENTNHVTNASYMYANSGIKEVKVNEDSCWDILDASNMFENCDKLHSFEVKENYYERFSDIVSETKPYTMILECLYIEHEDNEPYWIPNLTNMSNIFKGCINLFNIKIFRDFAQTEYISTDAFKTQLVPNKNNALRLVYDGFAIKYHSKYKSKILNEIEKANPYNTYIGYSVIAVENVHYIDSQCVDDYNGVYGHHVRYANPYAYKKCDSTEWIRFKRTVVQNKICNEPVTLNTSLNIDICWRIGSEKEFDYSKKIIYNNDQDWKPDQISAEWTPNSVYLPQFHKSWGGGNCYLGLLYTELMKDITFRLIHRVQDPSDFDSPLYSGNYIFSNTNHNDFNIPNKGLHFFNRQFEQSFIEPKYCCTNLKFGDEKSGIWYINQAGSDTKNRPYKVFDLLSTVTLDAWYCYQGDFCIYQDRNSESYPLKVIIPWGCENRFSNLFKNCHCDNLYVNYEKSSKTNVSDTYWIPDDSEFSLNELFALTFFTKEILFLLPIYTNDLNINMYRMFFNAGQRTDKQLKLYLDKYSKGHINGIITKYNNNKLHNKNNEMYMINDGFIDPGYNL